VELAEHTGWTFAHIRAMSQADWRMYWSVAEGRAAGRTERARRDKVHRKKG
jgi:hypothetical protein